MKQMIHSEFSFFKAGQGAFYGGKIIVNEIKQFTIIYDCGTSNFVSGNSAILNSEIDYFKIFYCNNSKDIDILFISHLDYDHISGAKRLLKEFKVKRIVLPYFPMNIRQFFLISIITENNPEEDDLSLNDYISFIENPYSFIKEASVTTEIFIINGDQSPETDSYYLGYDDNDSIEIYPKGDLKDKDIFPELKNLDCFLYANNLQFFFQKKWEFTTYVKTVNLQVIKSLTKCLNQKLKKNPTDRISFDDLRELITIKRPEGHSCYKKLLGDINSHGLVLLHGPINYENIYGDVLCRDELNMRAHCCYPSLIHHYSYSKRSKFTGTLLMGDTSLAKKNCVKFPPQFKRKLPEVHIFQIPHHGSSKNWDYTAYQKNLKEFWRSYHLINVCNFGYGNTYGHPGHQVLSDLKGKVVLNSQFLRFTITYHVRYR